MNYRKLFLLMIIVCSSIFDSFSQSNIRSYQLVVEMPTFTEEKTLPNLWEAVAATTGVTLFEYCSAQGWVVFEILEERYSCTQDPLVLLKELHIDGILKVGVSKGLVEANCKDGLHSYSNIKKN